MPIISSFYGVLIYIYREINGKHHVPHFHAVFAEYECVYDLEGNIIEGELPNKKHKMVSAWCAIHEDEILAAWRAWNESGVVIKIDGLR